MAARSSRCIMPHGVSISLRARLFHPCRDICSDPAAGPNIHSFSKLYNWTWSLISTRPAAMSPLARLLSFLTLLSAALGADQVVLSENAKLSNESLLWGPYKPNLYFGLRPRIPKSLSAGLLWAKVDEYETVQSSTFREYYITGPASHKNPRLSAYVRAK